MFRYGKHLWSEVEDEDDYPYGDHDSDRDPVHTTRDPEARFRVRFFRKFGSGSSFRSKIPLKSNFSLSIY